MLTLLNNTLRPLGLAAVVAAALLSPVAAQADLADGAPAITAGTVPANYLDAVDRALSEGSDVDQGFLDPKYDPYLSLSEEGQVMVTFIDEGAGYRNSLGWMSFSDGAFDNVSKGDIDTDGSGLVSVSEVAAVEGVNVGWVFPNASEAGGGGSLRTGDTVTIDNGDLFAADQNVTFFLGQNSYAGSLANTEAKMESGQVMFGLDFLNPESNGEATFGDSQDGSRHVAMLFADGNNDAVVMGFEDLNRNNPSLNHWRISSDEDFNDAVFIVTANPPEAIAGSNILPAPAPGLGSSLGGLLLTVGVLGFLRRRQLNVA